MRQAAYGNNILAEFDCIVDINYGILRLIQIKYNNSDYIKQHILDADDYTLKCILLERKEYNPLYIALKDDYRDNAESLYNEIINNEYNEVLKYSYGNALFGLMNVYINTEGAINVTVLCKNETQEQYIKKLNKNMKVIISEYKDIDTSEYDSYFVEYYPNILKYGESTIAGKSIFIPSYGYNLEDMLIADNEVPLIHISGIIGDVNKIYIVSPFSDFETPADEMVEDNDEKGET